MIINNIANGLNIINFFIMLYNIYIMVEEVDIKSIQKAKVNAEKPRRRQSVKLRKKKLNRIIRCSR